MRLLLVAACVFAASSLVAGLRESEESIYLSQKLSEDMEAERSLELARSSGPPAARAYTVPLRKSDVDSMHRASFLSLLKNHWQRIKSPDTAFIEEIPLQEQVLNEKRLATYFGEIQIGGQPFRVLFDTGSCEFWIPSYHCSQFTSPPERCQRHDKYNPGTSKTYQPFREDQKMSIQYLSGKVEGGLAKDTVKLGDLEVKDQVFGMADEVDVPLLDEVVWDGIVGLAYPNKKLAAAGVKPLFDTIIEHRQLQNNVLSYYLGYNGGAITLGGVDERFIAASSTPATLRGTHAFSHVQSSLAPQPTTMLELQSRSAHPFVYAKVVEESYWTIEIIDIELQYGDEEPRPTGVCESQENGRCRAIVDTGTYLIYGPRADVTGALGDVELSSCKDIREMPKITFVMYAGEEVEPARLTLHPHDYVLEFHLPTDGESNCNKPENRDDPNKCRADCVIGIGPDNDDGWTLGQVFLRSFYTVFDRDSDRVGFVRSNPNAL